MAKYMLLLHSDPHDWLALSPEQMQKAIEKFVAWTDKLTDLGIRVASHKLADDAGKVVRGSQGQIRVTDGPYSETKEVLGGYYIIEAASYEEAVERCRDCPSVEYGGTIEVRLVDPMTRDA